MRRQVWMAALLFVALVAGCRWLSAQDVLDQAMRAEMTRSMEKLRLEGLDKPYFIAYQVSERSQQQVSASFGSTLARSENHSRYLSVEVRVGDYHLDNTNFFAMPSMSGGMLRMTGGSVRLPLDDNYTELRRQIWLATDAAYKKAVEDLSGKRAALQNRTRAEEVDDFTRERPATTSDVAAPTAIDLGKAERIVRELSVVFREIPDVFTSRVNFTASTIDTRYLNSEGTAFRKRKPQIALTAVAGTQAPDGMSLEDFVAEYATTLDELPAISEMTQRVREMGLRLGKLRQAGLLDRYNGPVLFENQAAAELFAQIFASKLVGMRPLISDNPEYERYAATQQEQSFVNKLGARVLPSFLSVVDDPTREKMGTQRLFGSCRVDDDGIPTHPTSVVEDGMLKTLLTSRNPLPGISGSTGNRRGSGPMPTNVFVTAEKGLSPEALRQELIRLAQQRGKQYGILVRRIGNPTLKPSREQMVISAAGPSAGRAQGLLLAYKVFPDGREELIRNLELTDFDAAGFKDIVTAASTAEVYTAPFTAPRRPVSFFYEPSAEGSTLVSWVVPSLLLEDLTVKKPSGEVLKPPIARHPYFEQ